MSPNSKNTLRRFAGATTPGTLLGALLAALLSLQTLNAAAAERPQGYDQVKQAFRALGTARAAGPAHVLPPGNLRVILKTQPQPKSKAAGASALSRLRTEAARTGARVAREIPRQNLLAVQVSESQFEALVASGAVEAVAVDKAARPQLHLSVPFVRADLLHAAGHRGAGTAVAVLDTGIQADHSFFQGRVVEEACFSSGGDGVNSFNLCPNGLTTQVGPGAAQGCELYPDTGACYHGTHVAGIAAGEGGSMRGVAPQANIVAVQVFTYYPNGGLLAWGSDLVAAYDWLINDAATRNIAAVNMSLSGGGYSTYCDEGEPLAPLMQTLRDRGTASVVAAGNEGFRGAIGWPSCISPAVAVGATEHNTDVIAGYSNIASILDLLAPGSEIYSSIYGDGIAPYWGTSMAAPHVAGTFALLKSAQPETSIDTLEQALKTSAVPVYEPFTQLTLPRIDVYAAYQQLTSGSNDSCVLIPATVETNAGAFPLNQKRSWNLFARQGGLFRVWITSTAASGSHELRIGFADRSVNISVGAAQSALADFADINAGDIPLSITALSNGASLSAIRVEQLAANGTSADGDCAPAVHVPGVISEMAGPLAVGDTLSWNLQLAAPANLRIAFTGYTMQSSSTVTVRLDGVDVPLSFAHDQTVFADFAHLAAGTHRLRFTTADQGVLIGRIEGLLY